jgi:hypothetical protein
MSRNTVVAVLAVPFMALALFGGQAGGARQAVITQVETDLGVLQMMIHGRNFCETPLVTLGTTPLTVLSASENGPILAMLAAAPSRGGYLLTVDCSRGTNGFVSFDLTITCRGGGGSGGGGGGGGCGGHDDGSDDGCGGH